MKKHDCRTSRKKAFTLIELLVVIAIIAILAAILFPVFARARENARRSSCASNQKQLGLGYMQYAQDYDEKLPVWKNGQNTIKQGTTGGAYPFYAADAETNPYSSVYPYVKSWQIFRCSSATDTSGADPGANPSTSYMVNANVFNHTGRALASIPETSALIMLQDYAFASTIGFPAPLALTPNGDPATKYMYWLYNSSYGSLHFDGGNFLFADGHVKYRRATSICVNEYGLASTSICGYSTSATGVAPAF